MRIKNHHADPIHDRSRSGILSNEMSGINGHSRAGNNWEG